MFYHKMMYLYTRILNALEDSVHIQALIQRISLLFIIKKKINYSAQLWNNVDNVQQA